MLDWTPLQISKNWANRVWVQSFLLGIFGHYWAREPNLYSKIGDSDFLSVSSDFYRTRVRSLSMLVTHSLPNSLTNCCLVNVIDVTLACEDANPKLVEVVNVANVDDEDRVGTSLLQIWELRFGQKAKLLFKLWAQGLVKILKLKFRQDLKLEFGQFFLLMFCRGYEVESWSRRFWS